MVCSMTGYGRHNLETEEYKVVAEIKTVNHKYCNMYIKIPQKLNFLEDRIRKFLEQYLKRGRIEVNLNFFEKESSSIKITPNYPVIDEYYNALTSIKKRYKIKGDVNLELLTQSSKTFDIETGVLEEEKVWSLIEEVLKNAVESVVEMRKTEGQKLYKDISENINTIHEILKELSEKSDRIIELYKENLRSKIKELLEDQAINEERLEQEVAIYADKTDINEEIVRIKSHLQQYDEIFSQEGSVGRKLDFLSQEINREVNTIGSKSPDVDISTYVVNLKDCVGKIREQVKNIE